MKVTLFDYGAGNLHSLAKALMLGGAQVRIEPDPKRCLDGDALVLPGVGAFGHAAERLAPGLSEVRRALKDGLPCLGICLGMQLLFDASEEGEGQGLGVISGRVTRVRAERVPQIGWNALERPSDVLFERAPLRYAYYANSFVCRPQDAKHVIAWSHHEGDEFPAAVRAGNTYGFQFHPEKSSGAGLLLVKAFLDGVKK